MTLDLTPRDRRGPAYWSAVVDREAKAMQADFGVPDERMELLLIATVLANRPPEDTTPRGRPR